MNFFNRLNPFRNRKTDPEKRMGKRRFDPAELQEALKPEKVKEELTEMKTGNLTMNGQQYILNSLCNDEDMENKLIDEGYLPETERGSLFPCSDNRNYVVTTKIGNGALNQVYKTTNGLAFKLNFEKVNEVVIEMLKRGAYIQALLNKKCGKYIVKILDVGTMQNSSGEYGVYSIMEQFNMDMFDFIPLALLSKPKSTQLKKIFYDIFLGLKCINEAGFVHRDIKAENIGIIFKGKGEIEAKIFDFDFIVHIENIKEVLSSVGTLGYQDPTIIANKGCNIKSDVYSVGVLLYNVFANAQVNEHSEINLDKINDTHLQELIRNCTKLDPVYRCDAKTALMSPWFSELNREQDITYNEVERKFKEQLAVEQQQPTKGGKIKKKRSKNKYTKKLIKKRRTNKNKKITLVIQ